MKPSSKETSPITLLCCSLVALTCCSCGTFTLEKSPVTGSAYLFGVDPSGTNTPVRSSQIHEALPESEKTHSRPNLPGRLSDPYAVAMAGSNIPPEGKYQITLNRVWLRHVQGLEANVVIYADVFHGTNETVTRAQLFTLDGAQQSAFLPFSDVVLWGPVPATNLPVRIRVRVHVLPTKK